MAVIPPPPGTPAPPPSLFVVSASNPQAVFMVDAALTTKRAVPDPVTVRVLLAQTGQGVRTIADTALAAIPSGPPLPSRRDGVLYIGSDRAFDVIRGGVRRRVPDQTTLRSLGLAAWATLAQRFGARRAAWIVSPGAATSGTKTSDWTRAGSTALLPDRLIFTAYDAEGGVVRQVGAEIADGLTLGPSPGGGDPAT